LQKTAASIMSGTHSAESMARVYVNMVCSHPMKPSEVYSTVSRFSSPICSV